MTIVLARFMPFIRTFAPFVAGVAEMNRPRFTAFNVAGALIWVVGLTVAGYWFGNLPFVQQHLSKIIWALIIVPGLIAIFGAWRARRAAAA
jgi:membrane-associated protein